MTKDYVITERASYGYYILQAMGYTESEEYEENGLVGNTKSTNCCETI
jgi:hypothetical protein